MPTLKGTLIRTIREIFTMEITQDEANKTALTKDVSQLLADHDDRVVYAPGDEDSAVDSATWKITDE